MVEHFIIVEHTVPGVRKIRLDLGKSCKKYLRDFKQQLTHISNTFIVFHEPMLPLKELRANKAFILEDARLQYMKMKKRDDITYVRQHVSKRSKGYLESARSAPPQRDYNHT